MPKSNNNNKFLKFRSKYHFFSYDGFDYQYSAAGLRAQFHFNLGGKYSFHPTLILPCKEFFLKDNLKEEYLENLLFNIGMVEMISYWKAACPPEIIIRNYKIDDWQVAWWKNLYFKGLGEFFYLNSIDAGKDDFVSIRCEGEKELKAFSFFPDEKAIIPIGGGKDSVVTFEILRQTINTTPLILNPRDATRQTVQKKGVYYDSTIEVLRTIDPTLLDLNDKGFLNGHTPFSALLAFITALAAVMTGKKYIALSNESSANESTVPDSEINHQYSKSLEFEEAFREYISRYISRDIEYFSFLRPLNELQIGKLFSHYPLYFEVFRSCNAGSKTGIWCGKCSKCLFTWIILSPFISHDQMISIFGKNLWEDESLLPLFSELTGIAEVKPFECVGTVEEVNVAVCEIMKTYEGKELPALLKHYEISGMKERYINTGIMKLLERYDGNNFIPAQFEKILKDALHD